MKYILIALFFFFSSNLYGAEWEKVQLALNSYVRLGGGSGIITRTWTSNTGIKHGYILTAGHITDKYLQKQKPIPLTIYKYNYRGVVVGQFHRAATILESNRTADFGIVVGRLENHNIALTSVPHNTVRVGEKVYSVGANNSEPVWFTSGLISQVRPHILEDGKRRLGHNIGVMPGVSGSGLLNKDFEIIGINVAVGTRTINGNKQYVGHIGYAVPVDLIFEKLSAEKKRKYFQ